MSSRKKSKSVPAGAAELAGIAKANPYIQRLIEDADLRDNVRTVLDSGKRAYERLSNGKAPAKAIFEDKKLQNELHEALQAARKALDTLQEAPKERARKGRTLGRRLLLVTVGGTLALAGSEKLRSRVLDSLFGKEEEFQYKPPAGGQAPVASGQGTPVSAA